LYGAIVILEKSRYITLLMLRSVLFNVCLTLAGDGHPATTIRLVMRMNSKTKRILLDITDIDDGMLIPGGVAGRIESWPINRISEALAWGCDDIDFAEEYVEIMPGSTRTPFGVSLASWLEINCPDDCKVIHKGYKI
jgi:hypothetical protein